MIKKFLKVDIADNGDVYFKGRKISNMVLAGDYLYENEGLMTIEDGEEYAPVIPDEDLPVIEA